MVEPMTAMVCVADQRTQDWYLQPLKRLIDTYIKRREKMVDIEKIKEEIEALKVLNAQEYCAEQVAKIYADFEASRDAKIYEFERALEIFEQYQVIEEEPQEFDNLEG